jgi:site-specific DNA-cytosine methylase
MGILMVPQVPTAASLFSGAGGMSDGFRQAGFEIVLGADTNADAASTFCLNHPDTPFHLGNLVGPPESALGGARGAGGCATV